MTAYHYIAVLLLLCACIIAVLLKIAPEGYETDEGFFYGEPDGEG